MVGAATVDKRHTYYFIYDSLAASNDSNKLTYDQDVLDFFVNNVDDPSSPNAQDFISFLNSNQGAVNNQNLSAHFHTIEFGTDTSSFVPADTSVFPGLFSGDQEQLPTVEKCVVKTAGVAVDFINIGLDLWGIHLDDEKFINEMKLGARNRSTEEQVRDAVAGFAGEFLKPLNAMRIALTQGNVIAAFKSLAGLMGAANTYVIGGIRAFWKDVNWVTWVKWGAELALAVAETIATDGWYMFVKLAQFGDDMISLALDIPPLVTECQEALNADLEEDE